MTIKTLQPISFKAPIEIINLLDALVDIGYYFSRSEAIRDAVRRLVLDYFKDEKFREYLKQKHPHIYYAIKNFQQRLELEPCPKI